MSVRLSFANLRSLAQLAAGVLLVSVLAFGFMVGRLPERYVRTDYPSAQCATPLTPFSSSCAGVSMVGEETFELSLTEIQPKWQNLLITASVFVDSNRSYTLAAELRMIKEVYVLTTSTDTVESLTTSTAAAFPLECKEGAHVCEEVPVLTLIGMPYPEMRLRLTLETSTHDTLVHDLREVTFHVTHEAILFTHYELAQSIFAKDRKSVV